MASKKFAPPPPLNPHQRTVSSLNRTRVSVAPVQTSSRAGTLGYSVAGEQPHQSAASAPSTQPPTDELELGNQLNEASLPAAEPTATSDTVEDALVKRISELWSSHAVRNSEVRHSREQLRSLRLELGKDLSQYKKLLARTGRGGKWTSFLTEQRISRTTADRYIQLWDATQDPEGKNRVSGAISEPTADQIAALVKMECARLLKRLITPESRKRFIDALALAFEHSVPSTA